MTRSWPSFSLGAGIEKKRLPACSGRSSEYIIEGVTTIIPFQSRIMADANFRQRNMHTRYLEMLIAADRERAAAMAADEVQSA